MFADRGQGLNNAIKDAADIVDVIKAAVAGTQSLEDGITAYETEMRTRGTKEVELSFQQAKATEKKDLNDSPMFTIGHRRNDEAKSDSSGSAVKSESR